MSDLSNRIQRQMGQFMGQKWVRKNKTLKKVQKTRRFQRNQRVSWYALRDSNPRPSGP